MSDLTTVTGLMTGAFDQVKTAGLTIVTAGVGIGIVFVGAKWLWGKTRQWLSRV